MWLLKVSVNLTDDFNIFTNIVTDSPVLLWRTSSEMFFKKAFREDAVNLASVQMSCINRVASLLIYKSSCLQNVYKIGALKNFAKSTETSAQVFLCGFCEISKNIFHRKTLGWLLLDINLLPGGLFSCIFTVWFDVQLFWKADLVVATALACVVLLKKMSFTNF